MIARVRPGRLSGSVDAVTSKSCAHRALICAALSDKSTDVLIDSPNDDIQATARCLTALGARVERDGAHWRVDPIRAAAAGPSALDCGESGSTLRFLIPIAASLGAEAAFTGRGKLPTRPNTHLCEALRRHGARIDSDLLPMTVRGPIGPGEYLLPGDISSQYASGLLFALPRLGGDSRVRFTTPLNSRGYVALTVNALRAFGVRVDWRGDAIDIPGGQAYRSPGALRVEGDWSAAAFWLTANACGSDVRVEGLDPGSAQGDRAIESALKALGQTVPGSPAVIDARDIPDLVPALAVAAALSRGGARIGNAGRLRYKECDRLAAMAEGLGAMGADITQTDDGLIIGPSRLRGARVRGWNDHRIVMALAVAALSARGDTLIDDAEAVSKSYPGFWRDFKALGGVADVE